MKIEMVGGHSLGQRNERGYCLVQFCPENNIRCNCEHIISLQPFVTLRMACQYIFMAQSSLKLDDPLYLVSL